MKRHKNLERAIVLSLLMSSSIYGTVFAAEKNIDEFKNGANESNIINVVEDTTVNGTGKYGPDLGSGLTENTLWKDNKDHYVVSVGDNNLIFNDVNMYAPEITGTGNITINVKSNGTDDKDFRAGIVTSGNISGKNLVINAGRTVDGLDTANGVDIKGINTGGNNVYAENINDNNVTINVEDSAVINSHSDGVFTSQDVDADVKITAANGTIEINTTTRNGIYNGGSAGYDKINDIVLKAGNGISIKNYTNEFGDDTAGIKNKNAGSIILETTNGNIEIGKEFTDIESYTTNGTNNYGIYAIAENGNEISGTVSLEANNGNINIYATQAGIYATGNPNKDSKNVILNAKNNNIYVKNNSKTTGIAKGIYTANGAIEEINSTENTYIKVEGNVNEIAGMHADNGGTINIHSNSLNVDVKSNGIADSYFYGIIAGNKELFNNGDEANIEAIVDKDINVNVYGVDTNTYAVYASRNGNIKLESKEGNISINALDNVDEYVGATKYGIYTGENGNTTLTAAGDILITAGSEDRYKGNNHGIGNAGETKLQANNITINSYSEGDPSYKGYGEGISSDGGKIDIIASDKFSLSSKSDLNMTDSKNYGLQLSHQGEIEITAKSVDISSVGNDSKGAYIWGASTLNINNADYVGISSKGESKNAYGIQIYDGSKSSIGASEISINANGLKSSYGIYSRNATVTLTSEGDKGNSIYAGMNAQGYGTGHAIQAISTSKIDLNAKNGDNTLAGVIYAKDDGTVVNLKHEVSDGNAGNGSNYIYSSAHGSDDSVGDRSNVVAALYAQNSGVINVIAGKDGYNYIATDTELGAGETEQTVWAQQGGKINIDGQTTIVASNADVNTNNIGDNSLGIAITAGTGDISGLEELPPLNTTQDGNEIRSTVNITNASGSSITGDIVSGYGGLINIGMDVNNKTRAAGTVENIKITGNALAANGGKLNINLGNGGTWTGRADDYGDAGYGPDAENHQNFYNPAFSNDILEGGTVNLTMGDNSTWKVQGQSWITSVDTTNAQNATIDLVEANTDRNTTSHALTIYDLKGNANINMNLDGNRDVSDMLYVKNAQGEYNVALADAVTTEDMYANGLDGLRFATVGAGSNVRFNAGSYDAGVFNVEYEVGTDAYDGNDENVVYNGNSLDVEKPGTSTVDSFFGYQGEDPNAEENTSEIATYARMAEEPQVMALAEEPVTETTATTKEATATGATNYKLIARKGESLSDAGKTILNMSKANYSQAVYLDTLNKRLGEARYLEGDEGLWVRMRHDKIDKDSSYEITNNMYELGYDKKYESKDKQGYHRRGVAIDYMDGDTSYDDIAGGGETNRKGIWLYDTWIGNKGHYTDYVAKWGHLENSFDLYTKTRGEKVSGDYDNDVYSLSAEWGYKDPLKNGWYFEPQAQLQYARVTGADYETSQGTQVSVDGIDSLIARAGFRLGKDFGEEKKSTFYVKADILHEFLGDQDISVLDKTTDGKITSIGYDNDGTWYSVGLGFSTMLSDNSYAFLDVEKIFGNDNDNSYQINGGFNWLL